MARTKAELEAELKRLKQENAILKEAAAYDAQTIEKLKTMEPEDTAEVEALRGQIEEYGIELMAAMNQIERQNSEIAGLKHWEMVSPKDSKLPKDGQLVLVVAINIMDFLKHMKKGDREIITGFLVQGASYYESKNCCGFKGLDEDYIVIAWQPLNEPEWPAIAADALVCMNAWISDTDKYEHERAKARKAGGYFREREVISMFEGVRKSMERYDYQPATNRRGRDLILTGKRKDISRN